MDDHIPDWAVTPKRGGKSSFSLAAEPLKDSDAEPQSWHVGKKAAYLLGRNGQAVDVCVAHKSASRVHACLAYDDKVDLYLVDLGSAHGTFLNGERLQKHGKAKLADGDAITLAACPTVYRLKPSENGHGGEIHAERGSHAANEVPSDHSPVHNECSDSCAGAKEASNCRRRAEPEARNGHGKGSSLNGRRHRNRSSEKAVARSGDSWRNSEQNPKARRSLDAARRAEGDRHGRNGRDSQNGRRSPMPRRLSPIPRRPSPVSRRVQAPHDDRRMRRSPSYTDERSKRRRSPSRSPARQRQRERNEPSAAQKQRERQAAFRDPPASAAPKHAGDPIDIVRSMMGTPAGGSSLAAEQKKKLLWGAKKAEAPTSGPVAGHNRWDTAEFTSDADKDKFQRLMGVKRADVAASAAAQEPLFDRQLPQKEQQERLQGELERSFLEGVRRGNRHTVGLGL